MGKLKKDAAVWGWALKLAWKFSPKVFLFWLVFSTFVAFLPSIALAFNREVVSTLSDYLTTGNGSYLDVVKPLCMLGGVLVLSGLSRRINSNFLYMIMYDDFYFGMEEYIMDTIQKVEIKTLMDKEYYEEYRYCEGRCGSLTDVMSQGCLFVMKSVTTISLVVVAYSVSAWIGGIAMACFAITMVINYRLSMKLVRDIYAYRGANAESKYYAEEMRKPGVAKEMRIYKNQEKLLANWRKAYQVVQDFDIGYDKSRVRLSSLVSVCLYLATFLMLVLSVNQVVRGAQSVDVFLMLYLLGENLTDINKQFSEAFFQVLRGFHAIRNQYNFLHRVPMMREKGNKDMAASSADPEEAEQSDVVIQAENLSFSYDGKTEVLHNLNFKIHRGETIALVGSNGSGKTTLVKLLIQQYQPDSGSLKFKGREYRNYPSGSIQKQIGMFFQNFYLYHLTLRENVGFGNLKELNNEESIRSAIRMGGAERVLKKCKNGLEQILGKEVFKNGLTLSGGERQCVAVARTHMSQRGIMIFDEPAAALDPIAEMEQFRNIRSKAEGKTAILISHRVGFARMADRIFVMDHGRLAEMGTHEALIQSKGIYADLFAQQAQWYQDEGDEK